MAEPFVLHPDGSLQARWLAHEGLVDLRCLEDTVDAVQAILQIELPRLANRCISRSDIAIYWMAPLQWLIRVPEPDEQGLAAKLMQFSTDAGHASVTVVSDAFVGLRLEGSGASRVLSEGCSLDLESLEQGLCARTLLARAQIMLIPLHSAGGYDLFVDRSHADYLQQWIKAAANC